MNYNNMHAIKLIEQLMNSIDSSALSVFKSPEVEEQPNEFKAGFAFAIVIVMEYFKLLVEKLENDNITEIQ